MPEFGLCPYCGLGQDRHLPRCALVRNGEVDPEPDFGGYQDLLPVEPAARKATPICRGVLDYFPLAIAEIARISLAGNGQHNPGEPMHWAREKSTDHADCIARHLIERGKIDRDGKRHSGKMAWRALALLQLELEQK